MSAHHPNTRGPRPSARVAGGLLVMSSLVTGCTASGSVTPPGITSGSSSVPPGPTPTPIEEAAQCVIQKELTDTEAAVLPIGEVFLGVSGAGSAPAVELRPGPDAADPSRCPGDLPHDSFCDTEVPWSGLSGPRFITASGAVRTISQQATIFPSDAAPDANGMVNGGQTMTYRELDLAPGDPKGLVSYLNRAFTQCGHTKPTTLNGMAATAGEVSVKSSLTGTVRYLLLVIDRRVAWVVLQGNGWKPTDRKHALRAVTDHLRALRQA